MKKFGIERQALAIVLIPILLLSVLMEGQFIYTLNADLDHAMSERAKLIVGQLASSSEYSVFSGNQTLLQQQVEISLAQQDVGSVIILDPAGKVLAKAGKTKTEELFIPASGEEEAVYENKQFLTIYQPIVATQIELEETLLNSPKRRGRVLGVVVLEIDKGRVNAEKQQILIYNLMLTLGILAFAIWVAMRVSRRITSPILGMRTAVKKIGEGQLDTRIEETRLLELNELGQGINEMTGQLQQQRETLQQRIEEATLELREKKNEAEKANFDKTRFLVAASHDLRQPMHALGLFMGELNNRINTPEQRKIVEKVEESVEAMSGLLDSLLDISKLDAGIVVPQVQDIKIGILLRRLAQDYASLAEKKSITLRVRTADRIVRSDPVLLERILINLLGNAIRYTPHNGKVMLACRKRGDNVRIEVRDNGPGIPLSEQQNVFREFVQLANVARDRSKGLGLGLAIVDRLIKLMNLPIYLSSSPNLGSTFAIEIPCVPDMDKLPITDVIGQTGISEQSEFCGLKVLVVDDDPLVLNGTGGLLTSWGCQVSQAASLAVVRQQYSLDQFQLVVCDYRLPDGTGLQLADCLNTNSPNKPVFILISGDTSPDVLQNVASMGHHLLHKPVRPAKLRSMMSYLLMQSGST